MAELTNLSVSQLRAGYVSRAFSPVDVTEAYMERIDRVDEQLNSFITVTADLARSQAVEAERAFLAGDSAAPLTGIPVALKDAFHVAGVRSTLGSALYRDHIAKLDSGVTRRLRQAGAVFTGKTNTAEFGQSATCENLLGEDTANPWDLAATPGGSSGGSASAMAARLSALAVGSDGGGSIRIPAAFCGIYGLKTSPGLCPDEKGFRGMTDFVGAGPMTSSVADARILLGILAEKQYVRKNSGKLRIAYCPRPENLPVDTEVLLRIAGVASTLESMGHEIVETDLPIEGWNEIFGPLVLDDEHRERGHLLDPHSEKLTRYERSSLRAARALDPSLVNRASLLLPQYRNRMSAFLAEYDIVLTPTTAVPAFDRNDRPAQINGQEIDRLWGPFPFTVPFNVAGVCAASIPCGMVDGKPVGAQLVAAAGAEQQVLDLSEDLEDAMHFDYLAAAERFEKAPVRTS